MSRAYRLAKEGSWILSGQISSVIGSLVLVRVLTEYLEPSEYGYLALGLTFASLVNQLVMVGLIAGIRPAGSRTDGTGLARAGRGGWRGGLVEELPQT